MQTFKEKIEAQVVGIGKSDIREEEKQVLRILFEAWKNSKGKVTQQDLCERMFLKSNESLTRLVRKLVRDLRTRRWAPILSDRTGYWIPQNEAETGLYLRRVEHEVKSRVYASFETYKAMKESLGISSPYFEGQGKLIEEQLKFETPSKTQVGKTWEVFRVAGVGFICTCPGYRYRKTCSHIDAAAKKV